MTPCAGGKKLITRNNAQQKAPTIFCRCFFTQSGRYSMQITGLLLKAKIGRYLMRNGGGLDANIQFAKECSQIK